MKILKTLLAVAILTNLFACNKDEDVPTIIPEPQVEDTTLKLPATFTNNTRTALFDGNNNSPDLGITESQITLDKDGIIKRSSLIYIQLDLSHENANDISIVLVAPDGAKCTLIKRIDGATVLFVSGNILDFNSQYPNAIPTDASIPPNQAQFVSAGKYKPTFGSNPSPIQVAILPTMSSFFYNKNIKGIWKLKIYDSNPSFTGILNSWSIKIADGAFEEI